MTNLGLKGIRREADIYKERAEAVVMEKRREQVVCFPQIFKRDTVTLTDFSPCLLVVIVLRKIQQFLYESRFECFLNYFLDSLSMQEVRLQAIFS